MSDEDSLYSQLVNQLNIEFTLAYVYLKYRDEAQPIKIFYQKLRDDSLSHLSLIGSAIKALGKNVPKPRMLSITEDTPFVSRIKGLSLSKMREEAYMEIEKMEVAAASSFTKLSEEFLDERYSALFRLMRDEEIVHQRMLRIIRGKLDSPIT